MISFQWNCWFFITDVLFWKEMWHFHTLEELSAVLQLGRGSSSQPIPSSSAVSKKVLCFLLNFKLCKKKKVLFATLLLCCLVSMVFTGWLQKTVCVCWCFQGISSIRHPRWALYQRCCSKMIYSDCYLMIQINEDCVNLSAHSHRSAWTVSRLWGEPWAQTHNTQRKTQARIYPTTFLRWAVLTSAGSYYWSLCRWKI